MLNRLKWCWRVLGTVAFTGLLLISGVFCPLVDKLAEPITQLVTYFSWNESKCYEERLEDNYFNIYLFVAFVAALALVWLVEKIVWLVRNT